MVKEMTEENRNNAVSAIVCYAWVRAPNGVTPIKSIASIVKGEAPTGITVAFMTLDIRGELLLLEKLAELVNMPMNEIPDNPPTNP